MRPNSLVIQAFGPFAGTEIIDFDQLGSNPLFLINGPTGSGKSSILDAICFALYGQTTGKEREATQMRCDHAKSNLLTQVTLTFTLGDNQYRIQRSPTQEKPKSKGEGFTTHNTEACLWQIFDDSETVLVPKKVQDATRIIEERTGLNVEQFRQVMVLPQGKFREFLMADSGQREAIFSKLFQTQIYKRLEDALKERAAGIRKQVESLRNQIMGILQSADLSTEDEVQQELDLIKPDLDTATLDKQTSELNLANSEKQLEAGIQISKAFAALADTQKQLEQLQQQQPEFDHKSVQLKRAVAAQKITHLQTQWHQLNQSVDSLNAEIKLTESQQLQQQECLKTCQLELAQANENRNTVDELKQQLAELQKLLPKIDELAIATTRVTDSEKAWHNAEQAFGNCEQVIKTTKETISELEHQRQALTTQVQALPEKISLRATVELQGKQRAKLDELIEAQEKLYSLQASQLVQFDQCNAEFTQQETKLKTLEFHWHNNQAAILAADLKMDQPCPVCGSVDHPNIAVNTGESINKSDIDSAKSQLTLAQNRLNDARNALSQSEIELKNNEAAVKDWRSELGDAQRQSTDELREFYRQINNEVKTLETHQRLLVTHEADLKSLSEKHSNAAEHLDAARSSQQAAAQNFELAKQSKTQVEQQFPENYQNPDQILKGINSLTTKIDQLTQAYDKALLANNQAKEAVTASTSKLEQQNKQLAATTKEQAEAKTGWNTALVASSFSDEADFQLALLPEDRHQSLQKDIQQFTDQLTGTKASLAQQQKQLKKQILPDIEQLHTQRDALQQTNDQALMVWKQIDQRVQQLISVQQKLDEAHKTNKKFEDEYKIFGTLSDVANGQTGNKISLQRFVLSVLLDDVLVEASHRLSAMSKGRYQLLRKEDRAKGNKASGLELEVEDAYTGKTRSVSTLSGGESFMAALSLALGLSDVVQAYAGGIKLDTLFIDEGFGSLDQESLDLAIKTLIDLQATGRMIGIISHVSELREQMQLRVDVVSSASGSHIASRV